MTNNVQPNNMPSELERDRAEHRLSPELDMAVRRARERQPDSEAIMRCIGDAKHLGKRSAPRPFAFRSHHRAYRMTMMGSLAAAAAAVYLLATWNQRPAVPPSAPTATMSEHSTPYPTYSAITQVSLVAIGYRQVEADLDQAEAKLEQASEAIASSAVRREVQQTLEEFYDWSELGE